MDIFTTTFTLPYPSSLSATAIPSHAAGQHDSSAYGYTDDTSAVPSLTTSSSTRSISSLDGIAEISPEHARGQGRVEGDEAVQTLCKEVMAREGCLVTASATPNGSNSESDLPSPTTTSTAQTMWTFCISGTQSAVMAAKGRITREMPRDNTAVLKVKRSDFFSHAHAATVKADIRARLDNISRITGAFISASTPRAHRHAQHPSISSTEHSNDNFPPTPASTGTKHLSLGSISSQPNSYRQGFGQHRRSMSSVGQSHRSFGSIESLIATRPQDDVFDEDAAGPPYTYELEPEPTCDLVITGSEESVELARIRLLVLLDELAGLHTHSVEIDYKLQCIIGGRRRAAVRAFQEETSTHIYFSIPLVGVLNDPSAKSSASTPANEHPIAPSSFNHTGTTSLMPQATGQSITSITSGMSPASATPFRPNATPPGFGYPVAKPQQHMSYQSYQPYPPQPYLCQAHHWQHPSYPSTPSFTGWSSPVMAHASPSAFSSRESVANFYPASPYAQNFQLPGGPDMYARTGMSQAPFAMPISSAASLRQDPMAYPSPMGGRFQSNDSNMLHQTHGSRHNSPSPVQVSNGHPPNKVPVGVLGPEQYGIGQIHPGLSVHYGEQGISGKAGEVWVTGDHMGVQRAIEMLKQLELQKHTRVISRDATILPRKLDWLLADQVDKVREILYNNGTYLQVPPVGSLVGIFTVFGDHRVGIERTIRQLMELVSQIFVATVWLLPRGGTGASPHIDLAMLQQEMAAIARDSGAEVVFKDVCFEVYGLEEPVKKAAMAIDEIDVIQEYTREIRFRIELANEHREFISGKKNGKTNKIMKTASVKIKFETCNDYNFVVELSGASGAGRLVTKGSGIDEGAMAQSGVFYGFDLLVEELPAEVSFHVPESHHKRIIGVQGRTIQAIMKTLGVYVKFSNSDEHATMGGYQENEDNVVARTPRKNAPALEVLKRNIMELVLAKDRDYVKETIDLSAVHHRALFGTKSVIIRDIEHKMGVKIRFPPSELGEDTVVVFGPQAQVPLVKTMLLEHVPYEVHLRLEGNDSVIQLTESSAFLTFIDKILRETRTTIAVDPAYKKDEEELGELILQFKCPQSMAAGIGNVKDSMLQWLRDHGVKLPPVGSPSKRARDIGQISRPSSRVVSTSLSASAFELPPVAHELKQHFRIRPASTTNVKALFEGSSPSSRFTMPLSAYPRPSPDGMLSHSMALPATAPHTANMWHHESPNKKSAQPISGGLPFMSASVPVATINPSSPDAIKRPLSLISFDGSSALGLHSLSVGNDPIDLEATPKPSATDGRVASPQRVPLSARAPGFPRTRSSGSMFSAGLGGFSVGHAGERGFTHGRQASDRGVSVGAAEFVPRYPPTHQRTQTAVDVPTAMVSQDREDRFSLGQGYAPGHQRGFIGARAQSMDITGFDYGRYMRPVSPVKPSMSMGVREVEDEHDHERAVRNGNDYSGATKTFGDADDNRSRTPLAPVAMPNRARQA